VKTILHIDSSARADRSDETKFGSHTRRLTARFISRWRELRPDDKVIYRDVGRDTPKPVSGQWIHAAFTKPEDRETWMHEILAESDALVDELLQADIVVAGVPMYNFGMPAQFKAYIDNIVRVGRTFGFDRNRDGEPYWPLVPDGKSLVVLSSRGDYGYDLGERLERKNYVEAGVMTPFAYIGVTDVQTVAIEYDEFADSRLQASIKAAEQKVDSLIPAMVSKISDSLAA